MLGKKQKREGDLCYILTANLTDYDDSVMAEDTMNMECFSLFHRASQPG